MSRGTSIETLPRVIKFFLFFHFGNFIPCFSFHFLHRLTHASKQPHVISHPVQCCDRVKSKRLNLSLSLSVNQINSEHLICHYKSIYLTFKVLPAEITVIIFLFLKSVTLQYLHYFFKSSFRVAKITTGCLWAICLTHYHMRVTICIWYMLVHGNNFKLYLNKNIVSSLCSFGTFSNSLYAKVMDKYTRDEKSLKYVHRSTSGLKGCSEYTHNYNLVNHLVGLIMFNICSVWSGNIQRKRSYCILKDPVQPILQILFPHNFPIFQNEYSARQAAKQIQAWSRQIFKWYFWIEQRCSVIST